MKRNIIVPLLIAYSFNALSMQDEFPPRESSIFQSKTPLTWAEIARLGDDLSNLSQAYTTKPSQRLVIAALQICERLEESNQLQAQPAPSSQATAIKARLQQLNAAFELEKTTALGREMKRQKNLQITNIRLVNNVNEYLESLASVITPLNNAINACYVIAEISRTDKQNRDELLQNLLAQQKELTALTARNVETVRKLLHQPTIEKD